MVEFWQIRTYSLDKQKVAIDMGNMCTLLSKKKEKVVLSIFYREIYNEANEMQAIYFGY